MVTDFGVPFRFSLSDCFFRWGFEFLEVFFSFFGLNYRIMQLREGDYGIMVSIVLVTSRF